MLVVLVKALPKFLLSSKVPISEFNRELSLLDGDCGRLLQSEVSGERERIVYFIHKIPSTAYGCVARRNPSLGETGATRTLMWSLHCGGEHQV